jgi:hypothetical protein
LHRDRVDGRDKPGHDDRSVWEFWILSDGFGFRSVGPEGRPSPGSWKVSKYHNLAPNPLKNLDQRSFLHGERSYAGRRVASRQLFLSFLENSPKECLRNTR